MPSKGIVGRSNPWHNENGPMLTTRLKPQYDAIKFTVSTTTADYNVSSTQSSVFRSDYEGASTYSATLGYDAGYRHYFRIKSDNDFILKFNSVNNQGIKVVAGDTPFEVINVEANNIFLTSAATTTAQVQRVDTVADSSGSLNNKYFYLYAQNNATGVYAKLGVWFNVSSGGTQPTDATVTQWVPVAISTNATANTVATTLGTALDAVTILVDTTATDAFSVAVATNQVTITHNATFGGAQTDAADSTTPTGFTFNAPTTQGAGSALAVDLFMV